jgi:hypothetical protein
MQSPLRTDSEIIHVRLSGQDYYIPANYFDSPTDPGLDQRNVLLVALLPDMQGRTNENWDEFMEVSGWGRRVTMLITATKDTKHMLRSNQRAVESLYGPYDPSGTFYGLQRLTSSKKSLAREIYYAEASGVTDSIITCPGDDDFPTPGCSHRFSVDGVVVKATYDKKFLQDWQRTQASITTWLTELSKSPADTR